MPLAGRLVFAALLLGLLIAAFGVYNFVLSLAPKDFDSAASASSKVQLIIRPGESLRSLSEQLVEKGVIASTSAFLNEAALSDLTVYPGIYSLPSASSSKDIVGILADPESRRVEKLVVPEGLVLAEVSARASEIFNPAGDPAVTAMDFSKLTADDISNALPAWVPASAPLEGFFLPATYDVLGTESQLDIASAGGRAFSLATDGMNIPARAKKLGVTPYELVTIASIIQAEVPPKYFKKAAAVIYNRLKDGMRLQMDSTVNYGLGTSEIALSAEELASSSPYNTYRISGLPPTPIGNPSDLALEAAGSPASGSWLYFLTDAEGKAHFADTFAQFKKLKAKYIP